MQEIANVSNTSWLKEESIEDSADLIPLMFGH